MPHGEVRPVQHADEAGRVHLLGLRGERGARCVERTGRERARRWVVGPEEADDAPG